MTLKSALNPLFVISNLLFVIYIAVSPSPALAQELSLVVSPPSFDLTANPGEIIQESIKLTNNASTPVTLTASISDFIVQDDAGTPIKVQKEASGRFLASPWFTLNGQDLTLAPQETLELIVIIEVPNDALPGGHYAGVFFAPSQVNQPDNTGAAVVSEVGSLFALNVPGEINYDAQITSFTTSQDLFEFGPVSFAATIQNGSDTHITTKPVIEIKDMLGRSLSTIELDETNIFPFVSRDFQKTWDQVWGFGRYSAQLTAPYGISYAATRTLYFWIIPYTLIAAILVAIMVIWVLIIIIRRRKQHVEDSRDQEIESLKRKLIEIENQK